MYEGRVTGRTIPEGQIPSEAQIFRDTVEGGIEGTSREIFTGMDADGKFSVKSMALRGLVGVATGRVIRARLHAGQCRVHHERLC